MACTIVANHNGLKRPIQAFVSKIEAIDLIAKMMVGKPKYKNQSNAYFGWNEFEVWDEDITVVKIDDVKDWYLKGYEAQVSMYNSHPPTSNGYYNLRPHRTPPKARMMKMKHADWNYQAFCLGFQHAYTDCPVLNNGIRVTARKLF